MLYKKDNECELLELTRAFASPVKQYDAEGNVIDNYYMNIEVVQTLQTYFNLKAVEKRKKYNAKKRILNRIQFFKKCYFCTFTFNDDTIQKNVERTLKAIFKQCNIRYFVLIDDYGELNGRKHYHGFIDLYGVDLTYFEHINTKKYKNALKMPIATKRLGFNLLTPIDIEDKNEKNKVLGYCLKYCLKENGEATFDHRIIYDRNYNCLLTDNLPF